MEWLEDVVRARGHRNVRALHRTTFEVTRDDHLTPRGDCIIGVSADKAAAGLSREVREALSIGGSRVVLILETPGHRDLVRARGDPRITSSDERRIIVRRSSFVEPATIAVEADKAAGQLDRGLVEELREGAPLVLVVRVRPP